MLTVRALAYPLMLLAQMPQPTDATLPPPGASVVATAEGRGVQIYRCAAQSGALQWTLEAPEATLFQPGTDQQLGTHSAGPTWTWADGSSITGKVLAKQPSPLPGAVPWLLVQTQPTGSASGRLSAVSLVRRSDTQAGAAPQTACDAAQAGSTLRVPYKATYTFYTTTGTPIAH